MKSWIASLAVIAPVVAIALAPVHASAQTKKAAATKTAAVQKKAAAKPAPRKAASNTRKKAAVAAVAGAGAVGAAAVAAKALGPDEVALAQRVHTGRIACELGQFVSVQPDGANPGYFHVSGSGFKFHMSPVGTSTGVLRLEDTQAGAVWLQIANKSMLMNQKAGQRLADECMSAEQLQVAEAIKKAPPPSLLD